MYILDTLAKEHSKKNTLAIVAYIGDDPERFKELLNVFALGNTKLIQRAAWPLSYVAELQPWLVQPQLAFICKLLDKPLHVAVKRNVMRLLQNFNIPNKLMGIVTDKCFEFLTDKNETIAVKAFSMMVLYHICLKEPDLKNELIPILEDLLPYGTPGLKSRCKKILAALYKIS
ncbi:MAG: hypothetical protein H7296_09815 [Bacteroidia bacterium]|nr:hypothetical protein [Bacteroidia bacterium]